VTGTTLTPQASLWLLPFVALVGLRWRDHLIWAGVEAAYFVAVWLYIAGLTTPDRGLPAPDYAAFLLARVLVVVYLAVRVWLLAAFRVPVPDEVDPAEPAQVSTDELDELAGPMAGAPDRFLVRLD
jgi:hypothetical protein